MGGPFVFENFFSILVKKINRPELIQRKALFPHLRAHWKAEDGILSTENERLCY
jgi:hypothetical protein